MSERFDIDLRITPGDKSWRFSLYRRQLFRRTKVGYAILLEESQERFVLADLYVESALRRHGLGSHLLLAVLDVARSAGCRRLSGDIVAQGEVEPSQLIAFYQRYGFSIGPPRETRCAASVELLL